ncbi:hypothetical protein ACWGQ5_20885 [Streptomyces sp. NPDC055722]
MNVTLLPYAYTLPLLVSVSVVAVRATFTRAVAVEPAWSASPAYETP